MNIKGKDYTGTSLSFDGKVQEHKTIIRFRDKRPSVVTAVRYDKDSVTPYKQGQRLFFNTLEDGFVYQPENVSLHQLRVRFDYELD